MLCDKNSNIRTCDWEVHVPSRTLATKMRAVDFVITRNVTNFFLRWVCSVQHP